MFADPDAIRALGSASSAQAADLAAAAARLSTLPAAALGPVGARFVSALADAATQESRAVTALSARLAQASVTADASAEAYDNVDERAATLVSTV